jgi:hypothetical protein
MLLEGIQFSDRDILGIEDTKWHGGSRQVSFRDIGSAESEEKKKEAYAAKRGFPSGDAWRFSFLGGISCGPLVHPSFLSVETDQENRRKTRVTGALMELMQPLCYPSCGVPEGTVTMDSCFCGERWAFDDMSCQFYRILTGVSVVFESLYVKMGYRCVQNQSSKRLSSDESACLILVQEFSAVYLSKHTRTKQQLASSLDLMLLRSSRYSKSEQAWPDQNF